VCGPLIIQNFLESWILFLEFQEARPVFWNGLLCFIVGHEYCNLSESPNIEKSHSTSNINMYLICKVNYFCNKQYKEQMFVA